MHKCMECHKPCRKMYRKATECYCTELVCQKCILDYPKASHCARCGKNLKGHIFATYDCEGIESNLYHRECFLKTVQADADEIEEYKDAEMI